MAVAAGVLHWLAFPGVGVWPLALVALVPLYVCGASSSLAAALAGGLTGFTTTAGICYWLPSAAVLMGGVSWITGVLLLVLVGTVNGARYALFMLLHHRAQRRGLPGLFTFPLALAAAEVLMPVPFPASFAVTVHSVPLLIQIADIGGTAAVTFVLGSINAAAGHVLLSDGGVVGRWRIFGAMGLLPLALTLAYGSWAQSRVDREIQNAHSFRVGLVQADVPPLQKRNDPGSVVREHVKLTDELLRAEHGHIDLVVWSETAVALPLAEELLPSGLRRRWGSTFDVPIVLGAVVQGANRTLWNSVVLAEGDGFVCPTCRYDKQVLIPFAESRSENPLGVTFPDSGRFSAGPRDGVLPFREHRLGALVCYEILFADKVRELVRTKRPGLLLNLSNDGWFGRSDEPWLHLALAKFRAVEHRLFMVRATTNGVSAIIDPSGRELATTNLFERTTLTGNVAWLEAGTLYGAWGDLPWQAAGVVLLAWGFVKRRKRE